MDLESGIGQITAFRHRRYLIDKKFQMKYTMIVVAFSALMFAAFGYKLYSKELEKTKILQIQNLDVAGLVSSQDFQMIYYLIGLFVLQVVGLVLLGILLTHRIAGPVYRVHRYLEEVAETGKLKPLQGIRSRDEFHEFFDSLSNVITKVQARTEEQRQKLENLKKSLNAASKDPKQLEHCKTLCKELLESI